jgi:flagellar transcriptional activator FlhC
MPKDSRVDLRMRALSLARDCAELGARVRTIHHLTGLRPSELRYLLFSDQHPPPRGRTPDTREWYHGANLLHRMQASVVVSNFARLRHLGFAPAESLVGAYRYYLSLYGELHRISFDRAFDLAAHTEGLWIARMASFHVVRCSRCGSEYLDALGSAPSDDGACPFCRMIDRHRRDPRLTAPFRVEPLPFTQAPDWLHGTDLLKMEPDTRTDGDTPRNGRTFTRAGA